MIGPIRRARGVGKGWAVVLVGLAQMGAGVSSDVRNAEGRIDGDRWARRNIELIRQELAAPPRDDQGREHLTVLEFSVNFNPLLLRDPYAAEVAGLAEGHLPRAGANADAIRRIIALYRKPEPERRGMGRDEIADALAADRARPGEEPDQGRAPPDPGSIAERILRLPADRRAAREPALIAEMEASARDARGWGRLGLGYLRLARDATRAGDRARADRYVDRLLAVLRDHPAFQDPARGNVDAVGPSDLAAFLIQTGRRDRWDALLASQPDAIRADLAIGEVGDLALKGDFDAARAIIDRHVRPIRPDAAARLEAATRGEIVLPPSRRKGPGVPDPSPEEGRLQDVQQSIAFGQATRGEVETAGRMLIALRRDEAHHPAGEGRLASFEWSLLARRAAEAGHPAAARLGFDLANEMMQFDILLTPRRRDEKARLVREALALDQFEIADDMHQTTSAPGAWIRYELARVYRRRGENARAAALLDEAIAIAAPRDAKEGTALARIAVELQQMGQPDRAERALLDSLSRIHGEDFGFGGTSGVVEAAAEMDRVDLLDRLYERGDKGERLLLCIMASRKSIGPGARP